MTSRAVFAYRDGRIDLAPAFRRWTIEKLVLERNPEISAADGRDVAVSGAHRARDRQDGRSAKAMAPAAAAGDLRGRPSRRPRPPDLHHRISGGSLAAGAPTTAIPSSPTV